MNHKENSAHLFESSSQKSFEETFMESITAALKCYVPISLEDTSAVKLMNRKETKYLLTTEQVLNVFPSLMTDYNILEINNQRIFNYSSRYFDTEDLALFRKHQNGRANRFKIRQRSYVDTGSAFFEIKKKDNHGSTLKSRIPTDYENVTALNREEIKFLRLITPFNGNEVKPIMYIDYQRFTLVNKHIPERLTIDLNLTFKKGEKSKTFPEMAIIEVKQEKKQNTAIVHALKKEHIRSGSMSKYCLGIISMVSNIKHNTFKPNLRKIKKITKTEI